MCVCCTEPGLGATNAEIISNQRFLRTFFNLLTFSQTFWPKNIWADHKIKVNSVLQSQYNIWFYGGLGGYCGLCVDTVLVVYRNCLWWPWWILWIVCGYCASGAHGLSVEALMENVIKIPLCLKAVSTKYRP
jgi:hypothetical protein